MKKLVFTFLFCLINKIENAQSYIMIAPAITNTSGTFSDRLNFAIEFGKQWDAFSTGFDIGKTTLSKQKGKDTSFYIEFRPNLNVFQQGKFTNTLTIGIGYIFNAAMNTVTEFTSGIEYSYSPQIHFNMYFGQYYYSGHSNSDNTTFLGISGMYYFKKIKNKGLFNK